MNRFTEILEAVLPQNLACDPVTGRAPAFSVRFRTNGDVPFPQIIFWEGINEHLITRAHIHHEENNWFRADVPAGELSDGYFSVQIEGCRTEDIASAAPSDWIKYFTEFSIAPAQTASASADTTIIPATVAHAQPAATSTQDSSTPKIYYAIHKHMHQPYYEAARPQSWDGQRDEIFGSRCGPYTHFVPSAVRQYRDGGLPHAGLSTSWSGSLIEQLDRCEREGLCGGCFGNWKEQLRALAQEKTAFGNPRLNFAAFGFFHPLMALIPERDIVWQIEMHRDVIRSAFGVEASRVLFPPETAFHVRMIPALVKSGINAVIYDSIHRFRACKDYPYGGSQEGMLPPNQAEQQNPAVDDWLQLHNIWAGSLISPSLLKPEYVGYTDPDGTLHKIIAVPAERYIGNEDARGGFGALQYPDVLGQVLSQIEKTGSFDPKHPPFFVLHSDGDNHGGGAEGYYTHNTGQMVEWLKRNSRFELTTIEDYLQRFPPDPDKVVHIEPGSWSGADNGDPQFMKWFSRYREEYSPDLNSWAVLTALQNAVHSVADNDPNAAGLHEAERLLLTAETSCYWYWTGQDVWDAQVTHAANDALGRIAGAVDHIVNSGSDKTPPTIFAPWVLPENPGAKAWGQHGNLNDAPREATVYSFIHDITGLKRVTLTIRTDTGEQAIEMKSAGAYQSKTGARSVADFYSCALPTGLGDVRYFIEAEDNAGNTTRSALERIFLS